MDNLNDNLKELLAAEADNVGRELSEGDMLLRKYPAVKPDPVVIEGIKRRISAQLATNKRKRFVRKSSEIAAAAAVLVAGVFLSAVLMQNKQDNAQQTYALSSEWNISEDIEYSLIVSEIENIEGRVTAIRLDEDEYGIDEVDEIEMEIMDIEDAFGKG